MKTEITLAFKDAKVKRLVDVDRGLAIHKEVYFSRLVNQYVNGRYWQVTHAPSGLKIALLTKKHHALEIVKDLAGSFDWLSLDWNDKEKTRQAKDVFNTTMVNAKEHGIERVG